MIDSQLRTSGVNEEFVLSRMNAVAREDFVPEGAKDIAYMDRSIPLGEGQYLSSPLVHGMLLAEARPRAEERALVVENGNSYLAELVRPLVDAVDTISAEEAATGKPGRKKYALVLVDGAIEDLPESLVKRVEEGGRIISGMISNGVTRLASGKKVGGALVLQPLAELGIPVLQQFAKPKEWSF
ncbi:MAG TPA: protein-L-isoaspartate O-methyltransferase [Erythrobacter sp.]|nr:protein-L-isoaspartate O-methyltransferase [Erythrobacter sp.]